MMPKRLLMIKAAKEIKLAVKGSINLKAHPIKIELIV